MTVVDFGKIFVKDEDDKNGVKDDVDTDEDGEIVFI